MSTPSVTLVAPRAGAWIETTVIAGLMEDILKSLPVRGRGLKQKFLREGGQDHASLPVRGRGLKRGDAGRFDGVGKSLPVRGRGLKP